MLVNLDSYLGTHASAVRLRAERAGILANNLANGDTPNFKARDISFASALREATDSSSSGSPNVTLNGNHPGHIFDQGRSRTELMYRVPTQYSLDGNTVQTDIEKSEFTENTLRYEASLQLLSGKFSGLMKALKGE